MSLELSKSDIKNYLERSGFRMRDRNSKVEVEFCSFCGGGEHRDKWTMAVFFPDGNYTCLRGSCGVAGTFWGLVESLGDDPKGFYKREENWTPKYKAVNTRKPEYERPKTFTYTKGNVEHHPFTETAKKYIRARGLTIEAAETCKMFCDQQGNICFPFFYKDAEPSNVKVRKAHKPADGEPKAWSAWKDGLLTLWGFENYVGGSIVITFGEYDCVAVKMCGVENVYSVPNGDSGTGWIDIHWDALQSCQEIVLWTDNDVAGNKALHIIAERLGKEKIRHVQTEYKDANEMLLKLTKEVGQEQAIIEVQNAVLDAPWYWQSDLIQVSDIGDRDLNFSGFLTGFPAVDQVMGSFFDGNMTIHTGDSGAGKTTGLGLVILNAVAQGARVAVWSGEDDEFDFKRRLSLQFAGTIGVEKRIAKRSNYEYYVVLNEYMQMFNDFVRDKLFLYNKRRGVDENVLAQAFNLAKDRYGCNVFVMDNLMKAVVAQETVNPFQRQAKICNQMSDFAKDTKTHVHVVAHLNKVGEKNVPPEKNSVSGAKEITNVADNVIAWWRVPLEVKEQYSGDTLLCLLKHRLDGTQANFPLMYDGRTKRMAETFSLLDERFEHKYKTLYDQ